VNRRTVLTVLTMTVLLAACGIPVDRGPVSLSKRDVPFGLLDPSTSTPSTTSTTGPSPVEVTVQVFLLSPDGHLVAVSRDVAFPAPMTAVLGALVDGPTDAEAANGLQSAVPAQTVVQSTTVTNGLATVNLSGTFGQLVGQTQIEAVAQIVFTATALAGVTQVAFQLDGTPVAVPAANGADVATSSRSQYAPLAPS
jgi:sporulation and spore germination protein